MKYSERPAYRQLCPITCVAISSSISSEAFYKALNRELRAVHLLNVQTSGQLNYVIGFEVDTCSLTRYIRSDRVNVFLLH